MCELGGVWLVCAREGVGVVVGVRRGGVWGVRGEAGGRGGGGAVGRGGGGEGEGEGLGEAGEGGVSE
mgnify:CR=1 FL=1